MKKKFICLTLFIAMLITSSCMQDQNKPQVTGGVESSISQMGDIKRIKVTADQAKIRTGCSNDASVAHTPDKNSTFNVEGVVGDWFGVRLPSNQIGFIHKDQSKPIVVEDKKVDIPPSNKVGTTEGTNSPKTPKTPSAQTNSATLTSQEQEMINLVNSARSQNNLPALQVDMQLTNVARIKAQDMIDNNYFSHNSPKYGSPFDMMQSFGINFVQAGENIAGNQDVKSAHNALMNSPGHRKNILSPDYTHIGIGIRQGGPYGNMFSQMFVSKPK